MIVTKHLAFILAFASMCVGTAHAAVREVFFAEVVRSTVGFQGPPPPGARFIFLRAGDRVNASVYLFPGGNSSGFGLCLYYDSAVFGPSVSPLEVFTRNLSVDGAATALTPSCNAGSGEVAPGANTQVIKDWSDPQGAWPGTDLSGFVRLYRLEIRAGAFVGSTRVGLAASRLPAGDTFQSPSPGLPGLPQLVFCGTPTVGVSAVDGSETGPTPASFTVTLSSPIPTECSTNGFFPVVLSLGGTATVGTDYSIAQVGGVSSSGTVVTVNFPADGTTTTALVTAIPVDDSLVEGTESVTLTVDSIVELVNPYLGVGATASANIDEWSGRLDIDGNGSCDALTDGLLVIRYLFGLSGTSLTSGAIGPNATRTSSQVIVAFLDANRQTLDIDGNGTADALTDGLLIIRYLFGLRGPALITGAFDPQGTRTTATAIEAYLLTLMP